MIAIALILLVSSSQNDDDRIGAALWYTKQTKEQIDKLGEKIDALAEATGQTSTKVDRLQDKTERNEKEIAAISANVKSLELWRSESTGKLAVWGSFFAIIMGYATSALNRFWAKHDKRGSDKWQQ
ncbi:MAG: hypothetical protein E6Q97_37520 [Desulfurellales bacterium]|nr:MAG: hypothetical protein E6Q97_37520 [Desulfurellales bacterium]